MQINIFNELKNVIEKILSYKFNNKNYSNKINKKLKKIILVVIRRMPKKDNLTKVNTNK